MVPVQDTYFLPFQHLEDGSPQISMGLGCPGTSTDAASSAGDPLLGELSVSVPLESLTERFRSVISLRDAKGELCSSQTSRMDYLRTIPFHPPTGSVPPLFQASYLACLYLSWGMNGEGRGLQTENQYDRSQRTQFSRNQQLLTGESAQWNLFYYFSESHI